MSLRKEANIQVSEEKISENFELKNSSTVENNLVFKKPKKYEVTDDEKVLKILVNDKSGDHEISSLELSNYINSNKKLNKIVIEEVKLNDVKRTNLIFDQKNEVKQISQNLNLEQIEKTVNKDFFMGSLGENANLLGDDFAQALNALKTNRNKVVQNIEKKDEEEEVAFVNLSLKSEEPSSNIEAENKDDDYELKNVKITRHEIRRKNNKSLSKLYYRVNNHIELFKLGDSYLRDFNRGVKSLAFHSCTGKQEREKTVLGVCSFLNYNAKVTVTVVTDNIKNSLYHEYITDLEEIKKTVIHENITYTSYVTQGVEFVEFSELCDVMYQLGNTSFEEFLDDFVENSDVVLWDLPNLTEMDNKKELFYPVIRSIESVSLVVETNTSKYKDILHVKDYFDKYKVPFKGFVVA